MTTLQDELRYEALNEHLVRWFTRWKEEGKTDVDVGSPDSVSKHFKDLFDLHRIRRNLNWEDLEDVVREGKLDWLESPHAYALYQALLIQKGLK